MSNQIQGWMVLSGVINLVAYPLFIICREDNSFEAVGMRIFFSVTLFSLFLYGLYIFRNINREDYITLLRHIRMVYPFTWRFIMLKKGRRISPFTKSDFVRWWKCLLAHLSIPVVFIVAYNHGNFATSFFNIDWNTDCIFWTFCGLST